MIGIYFSGTGNTKYCLEKFVALYDRNIEITPLEDEGTIEKVAHHKDIIFAYPIYYSNLPKIVQDFICGNSDVWKGKHIFIIATMGLFSGDGAGVSARLFKRYGAHIWGGLHLKMPDCICDVKALKRTPDQNKQIVIQTSVYKGYKQDKIEMRGDRAEMSDFPLYLNTVAGGLDRRDQTIGGFSFVVKIYAVPVVEIIG